MELEDSFLLLSGISFSDDKNKAETLLQDFSLFYYFACCKINTSNMSKSTYFAGQPLCELSKSLGEAAVYDGFYHNHALCSHS